MCVQKKMPPNNKGSPKTNDETNLRLVLEGRRPVSKCYSTEETSVANVKIVSNGITHSKSQTNVTAEERQDKDGRGKPPQRNRSVCSMVDELLCDIYSKMEVKRRTSATTCDYSWHESDYCKCTRNEMHSSTYWKSKDMETLRAEKGRLERLIAEEGNKLVKHLKRKNFLLMKREAHYDVITAYVQAVSTKTREDTKLKFSLTPGAETGFSQWLDAMKMVAQLPGGMPSEFRTKLWLQLSEKHLHDQNIDWEKAEAVIFNEWTNPDDEELGVQIVKDLHRTGCSLFCGEQEHNQALLKRVLLAYARWNKNVGYCQGFNMLAALILQVMDRDERNAVKVMIYLIEGVLPESYFANNLRGLSVDMAVFRDLLRLRLPKLSKHLEALQHDTNAGTSYEPPLTNVFTMQWFLTLFSNCLPQQTVLRVWDLVFLYGNEILLRTALAIWGILQDRVITVESADEFYSIMGVVTREMLEFGLMDANTLVKMIAMVDPFPNELQELREKYLYNISPWTQSVQSAAKKGIRLFYSDPEDQDDTEDEDKIALATAYGVFRRRESTSRELQVSGPTLDISILKQQYAKLRQRQRQAHVIITAACSSNLAGSLTGGPSVSVNHLLMGKSALVNKGRRIGPPEGSIPPPNNRKDSDKEGKKTKVVISGETVHWKDAEERKMSKSKNKSKGNKKDKAKDEGVMVIDRDTEKVVTEISMKESLTKRDSDSGSSGSSTSTELCDDEFYAHTDFDSDSDASSYRCQQKSPDFIRQSPRLLESYEQFDKSPKRSGNGGCDKNNLKELENIAINLVNEIEEQIQTSEKLVNIKKDEPKKIRQESPPEVNNSKIDNTLILDTNNQLLNDNILKLEPEVPTYENVITREMEVSKWEAENPITREGLKKDNMRRKSDLALSVIKENLEMLSKFSQKGLEPEKSIGENKESPMQTEDNKREENGKRKLMLPLSPEMKTQKTIKTEAEPVRPYQNFLVERAISPMVDKTSKAEKVNKEVNTELTFGVEEVEISTSKSKLHVENESKLDRHQNEELLIPITSRKSREAVFREKDEIKQRIETSKSDWELKMKKIAELETTTREALNEIQTRSIQRKSLHRSLDRNPRRTYFGDDLQKSDLPKIELEWTSSMDDETSHRKMKISALSFDEITSRTEKLLGNPEFSRSEETNKNLSPEFELRKSKDSTSKFKKLIEESYGEVDVHTKTVTKKYEFLSSPTSPDYRTTSNVRYSEFQIPKKYAEGTKGSKYKDDIVQITQNGSKISVDFFERKCLAEKQKPETESECHSSAANFNPFPKRSVSKPKELGVKLGLYPTDAQSKKS